MLNILQCADKINTMTVGDRLCFKKINNVNYKGYKVNITSSKIIDTDLEDIVSPPTSSERWVPACNPDGSPLSDFEHAEWVFNDGQTYDNVPIPYLEGDTWYYDTIEKDGRTWYTAYPVYIEDSSSEGWHDNGIIIHMQWIDEDGDYSTVDAYRKYIPGHWEDVDGNWINGSWSWWSYEWSDEEGQWMMGPDYVNDGYPSQSDKNAVIGMIDSYIETRTWNNTKPAPSK